MNAGIKATSMLLYVVAFHDWLLSMRDGNDYEAVPDNWHGLCILAMYLIMLREISMDLVAEEDIILYHMFLILPTLFILK